MADFFKKVGGSLLANKGKIILVLVTGVAAGFSYDNPEVLQSVSDFISSLIDKIIG